MSMRLVELNPRFVDNQWGDRGVGLLFDCPCGKCGIRCHVPFSEPIAPGSDFPVLADGLLWQRTGDTFETLSLTPSIHRIDGCGWHGHIHNGEVSTV
jgi:hypothetical protein